MFIVHVYPRLRGVAPYSLTYFSKVPYPRGAVLTVTLRKAIEEVVVASCADATVQRHDVKQLTHGLSAIKEQAPQGYYSEALLSVCERYARERIVSPGVLCALFPYQATPSSTNSGEGFHHLIVQKSRTDRYEYYRQYVRSVYARGGSVVIIAPTMAYAQTLHTLLALPHSFLLGVSEKKDTLARTEATTRATCTLIGPPSILFEAHASLATLIIEGETSPYFDSDLRPFVTIPFLARLRAKEEKLTLVTADVVVSVETACAREREEATDALPPAALLRASSPITIVDMKKEAPKEPHLAPTTRSLLRAAVESKETVYIVSGRRGLASHIVCGHCSTLVTCDHCASPLGLFGGTAELSAIRFYCRHCTKARDAREVCRACGSWKLVALGSGSERLERDVRKLFPEVPVLRIDADTARGTKQIAATLEKAREHPSIVIGTERMVPYLPEEISYLVMVGHDAHLSLPHFDANLGLFRNGMELRERVVRGMCIETRLPTHPVLTALRDGTIAGFLDDERAAREQFGFPPFRRYIEIACIGKKESVQKTIASLMRVFASYDPVAIPHGAGTKRGSALILRPRSIDEQLRAALFALPPHVVVRVR